MGHRLAIQNGGIAFLRLYMESEGQLPYYIHVYDDSITNHVSESAIHNHPFDFESTVLQGVLSHTLYEATISDGGKHLNVNYTPTQGALGKVSRMDNYRYKLRTIKDQILKVGDTFKMVEGEIHAVTGYQHVTITNVKILSQRPGKSNLFMTQEQMDAVNKRYEDHISLNVEAGKKVMEEASVSAHA